MNVFNRIMLTLICLALLAGSIGVIAVTWLMPDEAIQWVADASVWLDDHNTTATRALITLGAVFVGLVALLLILAEISSRPGNEVQVTGLHGGAAVLTTAAIAQRIEEAVTQVPHVSDVRATVRTRRKGVLLGLDLHVDPDANLAEVTDAACDAAREVLNEKVHVALVRPPSVRLHYRELRLQGRQRRAAVPAAPARTSAPPGPAAEPAPGEPWERPATEPERAAEPEARPGDVETPVAAEERPPAADEEAVDEEEEEEKHAPA